MKKKHLSIPKCLRNAARPCPGILLCFFFLCFYSTGSAQPGALDLSFDPGIGANDLVKDIAIQPDGKIVVVGHFTTYNNLPCGYLVRLNTNGSLDTTFHTGMGADARVYTVALQADGKIVIGGNFRTFNNDTQWCITRLNSNGSMDTSFHIGTGFRSPINAIELQTDGKIVVGGNFILYNGITCQYIARLHPDGTLDNSFSSINGANASIEALAIQNDGKIVIGGSFSSYSGLPCLRVARLNANGSLDTNFNPFVGGASNTVYAIDIQTDGKILLGGDFDNYNGVYIDNILRVSSIGAIDNTFSPVWQANSTVYAIQLLSNGKMLVGGNFVLSGTITRNHLALLNADGSFYSPFKTGTGPNARVYALGIQTNGKILIGGNFTSYNGIARSRIARLYDCAVAQPGTISGSDSTLCSDILTYSIAPVPAATGYVWTLPAGWVGSSNSTSITAVSNGNGGVISVRAFNDSCGYSSARNKNVYQIRPPTVPICVVTVDSASTHNILVWEKPSTRLIDSFFIYRETTTNVYTKIAAVPYDSLSEYHDYAANPNATSYRYKLSVFDTCGIESQLSKFHNSIHLQNLGLGNFQWTFYQIEDSLNPVLSFNVYRDNLANGNFSAIGNVPGTNATFTDLTYTAFPNADYVVDVNWSRASCTPSRGVNTTRSNIRHGFVIDTTSGIDEQLLEHIEIYPNPVENLLQLKLPAAAQVSHASIFNSLGQIVWHETPPNKAMKSIDVESFTPGFYMLHLETSLGAVVRKFVVE